MPNQNTADILERKFKIKRSSYKKKKDSLVNSRAHPRGQMSLDIRQYSIP